MGKLIDSMLMSLDGRTEDEHGRFGWGAPEDEEVHSYINALASALGTYLYGQAGGSLNFLLSLSESPRTMGGRRFRTLSQRNNTRVPYLFGFAFGKGGLLFCFSAFALTAIP